MATEVGNLWPEHIRPGILSPLAILRSQAEALTEQTDRVLVGEVVSEEISPRMKHTLFVVVPALDSYRYTAVEVAHHHARVYPCFALGPGIGNWRQEFNDYLTRGVYHPGDFRANNQDEFLNLLEAIFTSTPSVAALQGLIARVSEI